MSAQPNFVIEGTSGRDPEESSTLLERFSSRRSKELVIAFAGPIGSGIGAVINIARTQLMELGYTEVVHIKLSDFLSTAISELEPMPQENTNEEQQMGMTFNDLQASAPLEISPASNVLHISSFRRGKSRVEAGHVQPQPLRAALPPSETSEDAIIRQVLAQAKRMSW